MFVQVREESAINVNLGGPNEEIEPGGYCTVISFIVTLLGMTSNNVGKLEILNDIHTWIPDQFPSSRSMHQLRGLYRSVSKKLYSEYARSNPKKAKLCCGVKTKHIKIKNKWY